ncbi:hypothetical protein [Streptomyces sp. 3N207]|uniref:hypothetical protein n=1 Tax=Streptomyces sp. 3N207 TaxID=3457417 RepID=UPI003FD152AC
MGDHGGPVLPGEKLTDELAYKGQLQVPKETVNQLTKGIRGALDELREVGTDVDAAQGSGFEEMSLSKMEVGDDALSQSFEGTASSRKPTSTAAPSTTHSTPQVSWPPARRRSATRSPTNATCSDG